MDLSGVEKICTGQKRVERYSEVQLSTAYITEYNKVEIRVEKSKLKYTITELS